MGLKTKVAKWRKYSEMSNLGIIARRKFFNNAFDGALTCAGIVSGSFIIFIPNPQSLSSAIIIITGLSTALAIGISGLWGAFLSEEAERKKKMSDLKKEMVIFEEEHDDKNGDKESKEKIRKVKQKYNEKMKLEIIEIQKAMITPIKIDQTNQHYNGSLSEKQTKNNGKKS